MKDMKSEEKVEDFGRVPTYCYNCKKKTLSIEEISMFVCSECTRGK